MKIVKYDGHYFRMIEQGDIDYINASKEIIDQTEHCIKCLMRLKYWEKYKNPCPKGDKQ